MEGCQNIQAVALIATAETDQKIREREFDKGRAAKLLGVGRSTCPWNGGLTMTWWLEGYDSISVPNS
jgi:ribosome modulation factor